MEIVIFGMAKHCVGSHADTHVFEIEVTWKSVMQRSDQLVNKYFFELV